MKYISDFEKIVLNNNMTPCSECIKFSSSGRCYTIDNEIYHGTYWFYETENYIIDIHDIFVRKDVVVNHSTDLFKMDFAIRFFSTYIIIANGEWFEPYQNMSSNSVLIMDTKKNSSRYLLHGNYPFFSVSIIFKNKMFENDPETLSKLNSANISAIYTDSKNKLSKGLAKIAYDIINCTLKYDDAKVFFEEKVKEWLKCTFDATDKYKKTIELTIDDEKAIHTVEHYINDHYSLNISQEILEKISLLSGTNLKTKFKQKNKMSITEYIQRKRINAAENLLTTTTLDIKDIANSVGYSSSSRFSTLFKRYKGVKPNEIRKYKTCNNKYPHILERK